MKKLILLILAIIISSCGVNSSCDIKSKNETYKSREFSFSCSVDVEPSNNKKLEMWLPVPQSNSVQEISNVSIDSDGLFYEFKEEKEHKNKYVYIYSNSGTNTTKKVVLSFDIKRFQHQNVNYDNVNSDNYLSGSSMVPVGSVFDKIVKDNKLAKDNMKGVYNYVLTGMHYGKPTDDKASGNYKYVHGGINPKTGKEWLPSNITYGLKKKTRDELTKSQNNNEKYAYGNGNSLYACDIGVGNCTDYHSYFISLSRTLEIPARFHMGFPIPSGKEGKVKGYHCWADYYIDGEGWHPVDISEADKDPSKAEYFFGTVDESRVEMMIGRDFSLDEYSSNPVNLFIYPLLEVEDKSSKNFKKSFSFKEI